MSLPHFSLLLLTHLLFCRVLLVIEFDLAEIFLYEGLNQSHKIFVVVEKWKRITA
jgi:hypothetical protein